MGEIDQVNGSKKVKWKYAITLLPLFFSNNSFYIPLLVNGLVFMFGSAHHTMNPIQSDFFLKINK